MFQYYPYLSDEVFLKNLDEAKNNITYARITVTDINDNPIECIEGYVTQGNINKNGTGAVRVTGSITIVADENNYRIENIDNIISINKRVYLEVGRQNVLDKYTDYDIIWFPQGIMGISQSSIQHTTQNYTISLNFKDKMIFLNGELGGTLPAAVTFSPQSVYDEDRQEWAQEPVRIDTILFTLINELGGIPKEKIIIKDLDHLITNVCSWGTTTPGWYDNSTKIISLDEPESLEHQRILNFGDILGYTPLDFVYPGELSCNAGDTIVSVLDKIKNALGNYEYFFDYNGNFVWQQIPNALNIGGSTANITTLTENDYAQYGKDSGRAVYSIDDTSLITSISSTPQYAKVRNDFTVWGKKNNVPIRYHLVIDDIPKKEQSIFYVKWTQDAYETAEEIAKAKYNGNLYAEKVILENEYNELSSKEQEEYVSVETAGIDWRTYIYLDHIRQKEDLNYIKSPYAEELYANWPLVVIFDINPRPYEIVTTLGTIPLYDYPFSSTVWNGTYFLDIIDSSIPEIRQFSVSKIGRRPIVLKQDDINCLASPDMFAPGENKIHPYVFSASTNKTAKYRNDYKNARSGYIQVNKEIFDTCVNKTMSSYSAYDYLCSAIHEYISYNETVSMTAIPVLQLEPNTRIQIKDSETSIIGDYLINSLSIPLTSNGTMNINAKKTLERYGSLEEKNTNLQPPILFLANEISENEDEDILQIIDADNVSRKFFEIYINDFSEPAATIVKSSLITSFSLNDLNLSPSQIEENYIIKVKSNVPDYGDSEYSNEISYCERLKTPTLSINNDTLIITDNQDETEFFIIYLNGNYLDQVNKSDVDTQIDLSDYHQISGGRYNITVTANANNYPEGKVSDSVFYIKYSEGLSYEKNNNDNSCFVSKGTCTDTYVIIPSYAIIDGEECVVTAIGTGGFTNYSTLENIEMPNNIITIGSGSFENCSSLESIIIPSNVENIESNAFKNCSSLENVTFNEEIEQIGNYAFYNCSAIQSVIIPKTVTDIGIGIFAGCSNLINITVEEENQKYHSAGNCIIETQSGELIMGCKISIIPDNGTVIQINESAFQGCGMLSLTIPNSINSIGNRAFKNCSLIESIIIPNSVLSIEEEAFSGCSSLVNVSIANSVIAIGENAFLYCSSIENVYINSLIDWCGISFEPGGNPLSYADNLFLGQELITELELPNDIVSIGDYAFYGYNALIDVLIPESVIDIGANAFANCEYLETIWYNGYLADWNNVTKGNNWDNNAGASTEQQTYDFVPWEERLVFSTPTLNNCYVTGIGTFQGKKLFIPATTLNGETVVGLRDSFNAGNTEIIRCATPDNYYINRNVFKNKVRLKAIIFDRRSIMYLDSSAFYGCTSLEKVKFGQWCYFGGSVFSNCTSLKNIIIPATADIGGGTFSGCSSLINVSLPATLLYMGGSTFSGCSSLKTINIPNSLLRLSGSEFSHCSQLEKITFGEKVSKIPGSSFIDCPNLESIIVDPNNTTYYSINNCLIETTTKFLVAGNSTGTIPNDGSVTTIGAHAFSYKKLENINIPNKITTIKYNAFEHCENLKSVVFSNKIKTIDADAFDGCDALVSVYITDLARWCDISFEELDANPLYRAKNLYLNGTKIINLEIPNGVSEIKYGTFCCLDAESISIPSSVTNIGKKAFYLVCPNAYYIYPSIPPTIGSDVFGGSCPIYVPSGNVNDYKTAWPSYASRIQAMPT